MKHLQIDQISIKFNKNSGGTIWVDISVNEQKEKVAISYIFPPFDEMMQFLVDVKNCKEPSIFKFDEEGKFATFFAGSIGKELIRFMLFEGCYYEEELLSHILYRDQFIEEISKKFLHFLRNDYDDKRWCERGESLKESDYRDYFEILITDYEFKTNP